MENALQITGTAQNIFRTGGMEILLVTAPNIKGQTPLALHCKALIGALCTYAEEALLPAASHALKTALAARRLFAFSRHKFCISLETVQEKAGVICTLRTSLWVGEQCTDTQELRMRWTADEQVQKRLPRRLLPKKSSLKPTNLMK